MIIPCAFCGYERSLRVKSAREIAIAEQRQCARCGGGRGAIANTARQAEIDPITVVRIVDGDRPKYTTRAERWAAVAILTERGESARAIAAWIGVTQRSVVRARVGNRRAAEQMTMAA